GDACPRSVSDARRGRNGAEKGTTSGRGRSLAGRTTAASRQVRTGPGAQIDDHVAPRVAWLPGALGRELVCASERARLSHAPLDPRFVAPSPNTASTMR